MDGDSLTRCSIALLIANDASTRDLSSIEKEKLIDGYCAFACKTKQQKCAKKGGVCIKDLIFDDANLKNEVVFKSKTKASMTNNLSFNSVSTFGGFEKKRFHESKLGAKWSHPSGLAIDKFEVDAKGNLSTEASFEGLAPGLTVDFKSDTNDKEPGEFSFTYKIPIGKFKSAINFTPYSSATLSVSGDTLGVATTYSADFNLKNHTPPVHKIEAEYHVPNNMFFSMWLNSNKDFKAYSAYKVGGAFFVAAEAKRSNEKLSQAICGVFAPCSPFNMKLKLGRCDEGKISLSSSVSKSFDKNFKVTGFYQPITDASFSNFGNLRDFNICKAKWGVNCQLG